MGDPNIPISGDFNFLKIRNNKKSRSFGME